MIAVNGLYKSFGIHPVLRGISLEFAKGEITAVVGPSGTGKSVLIKLISGLLFADRGEILIEGVSMTNASNERARQKLRQRMGMLFQAAALLDSLNLYENVAFPLRQRGNMEEAEINNRVIKGLEAVGLRGYELALPGEVSIGMKKRVGIARALVTEADIIFFDEPNTGLDPQTGQEIYDLIKETHEHFGFTGIVISHEIPEVFQVCSKVAMIYDGLVQHDGGIKEFLHSDNAIVRQFVEGKTEGPIQMQ